MDKRKALIVAGLWAVAAGVLFVPGGVVTQIWNAERRFNEYVDASPLHKLCFKCNQPAVTSASYSDGSTRYFCKDHPPPASSFVTSAGDQGRKKFDPVFSTWIVTIIFGIGIVRAGIQPFTDLRFFRTTVIGGVCAIAAAGLLWVWFSSR